MLNGCAARVKGSIYAIDEAHAVNEYRNRLPARRDGRLHSPALVGPRLGEVLHWHGLDAPVRLYFADGKAVLRG
jgi:hypothetical protein